MRLGHWVAAGWTVFYLPSLVALRPLAYVGAAGWWLLVLSVYHWKDKP